jgi:hypothetical protein
MIKACWKYVSSPLLTRPACPSCGWRWGWLLAPIGRRSRSDNKVRRASRLHFQKIYVRVRMDGVRSEEDTIKEKRERFCNCRFDVLVFFTLRFPNRRRGQVCCWLAYFRFFSIISFCQSKSGLPYVRGSCSYSPCSNFYLCLLSLLRR